MEVILLIVSIYGLIIFFAIYKSIKQHEVRKEAKKIEKDYLEAKRQYLNCLKNSKESIKYNKRNIDKIESGVDEALLYGSNIELDNALERLALRKSLDDDLEDF